MASPLIEMNSEVTVELINNLKCLNINGKLIIYGSPEEIDEALHKALTKCQRCGGATA